MRNFDSGEEREGENLKKLIVPFVFLAGLAQQRVST
jgi:hypothetical protein